MREQRDSKFVRELLVINKGSATGVLSSDDFPFAMRMFKQKVKDSKKLIQYRDNEEYVKPSIGRRLSKLNAIYSQKMSDMETRG